MGNYTGSGTYAIHEIKMRRDSGDLNTGKERYHMNKQDLDRGRYSFRALHALTLAQVALPHRWMSWLSFGISIKDALDDGLEIVRIDGIRLNVAV